MSLTSTLCCLNDSLFQLMIKEKFYQGACSWEIWLDGAKKPMRLQQTAVLHGLCYLIVSFSVRHLQHFIWSAVHFAVGQDIFQLILQSVL